MPHGSPQPTRSDSASGGSKPVQFEMLQIVYVRDAHPDIGLSKGEHGTVVEIVRRPSTAYLIEFVNDDGTTRAEAFFTPEQLSAAPPTP
jgi:hypothetical protein